jgi:protoheme IX farnesyltransferase
VAALLRGARFIQWSVRLYRSQDSAVASATFRYSITYLMGLFAALLVDHYL